jgi:hypothetical protein
MSDSECKHIRGGDALPISKSLIYQIAHEEDLLEALRFERARADALEARLNAFQTRAAQNLLTSPAPFCPRPGEIGFKE